MYGSIVVLDDGIAKEPIEFASAKPIPAQALAQ
jgi:hypothetical protein